MRKYQQTIWAVLLTVILIGLAYWAGQGQPTVIIPPALPIKNSSGPGGPRRPADLTLTQLPADQVPAGYPGDLAAAVGRFTLRDLEAGEFLCASALREQASGIAYPNPRPGRRLMTVELPAGAANGFYLAAGNRIDLILVPRQKSEPEEPVTILSGIEIMAVLGSAADAPNRTMTSPQASALLCLDVDAEEAIQIARAKSYADIQVSVQNEPLPVAASAA
jgi:Flp pilus assembly protein CpaB